MNRIINNPNLPSSRVTVCAVGERYPNVAEVLRSIGIDVIMLNSSDKLQNGVCSHADMLMLHLPEGKLLLSQEQKQLYESFSKLGYSVQLIDRELQSEYPGDVILNAACIGKCIIGCKSTLESISDAFVHSDSIKLITVKQGYSKCSLCPVAEDAAITDDTGIYYQLLREGFDMLLINRGDVQLEGYNYGFIGGACGMISDKILAINGNIGYNTTGDAIRAFLSNRHIDLLTLNNGEVTDIGGILPLVEYCDNLL